jgi:hypothetical protein
LITDGLDCSWHNVLSVEVKTVSTIARTDHICQVSEDGSAIEFKI